MPVLLFLNELSCSTGASPNRANEAMVQFVELLRTIRQLRRDIALVTHAPFKMIELADGYNVARWIAADPANRDRWRLILSIQNRSPVRSVMHHDAHHDVEYRRQGRLADGLKAAHLLDGLAVSLRLDVAWADAWVWADRSMLAEDDVGEAVVREDRVNVRHAATGQHVAGHKAWIRESGRDGLTAGSIVWERREHFFPHVSFLPRVQDDLQRLRQDWVRPVVDLLLKLESAVADWKPGQAATPTWRTKVTGESGSRLRLCEFDDLDGVVRVFDLHARFTPGAGRLHFRLVPDDGTARVAYLGRKLGI